jgi:type IV secretory pathway VirB2 component (pilin)
MNKYLNPQKLFTFGLLMLLIVLTEPSFASSTSGGGLPFDTWLTKISNSITGPFAFSVSIIGLVAAGAALIFGGDMNGFMRSLIFIVLVLAFIIAAKNTLSAITGKGAQIGSQMVHIIRSKS